MAGAPGSSVTGSLWVPVVAGLLGSPAQTHLGTLHLDLLEQRPWMSRVVRYDHGAESVLARWHCTCDVGPGRFGT